MRRIMLIAVVALLALGSATAQRMPERHLVRKGNRQFAHEKYDKSIESYTRAAEAAPTSFEAAFNLANAQFRAKRYDTAEKGLARLAADSTRSDIDRSEAAYNLGDVQFAQQKLKEALASYRQAMRLNPDDKEAKYNYAYTKRLLEQQEQNQDQNKENENKNDKDNQNKDSQDQKQQQDGNDQKQNGDQDQNQDKDKEQDGQPQEQQGDDENGQNGGQKPSPSGISEQEREAMLEAIQAQEDKTQDKLKEKAGVVIRGRKNW